MQEHEIKIRTSGKAWVPQPYTPLDEDYLVEGRWVVQGRMFIETQKCLPYALVGFDSNTALTILHTPTAITCK